MARDNKDIWDLVDFDPVCTQMSVLYRVIATGYPHFLGAAVCRVLELLRSETYDRISGGENDGMPDLPGQSDGSQPVSGRRKRREESV